MLNKGKELGHGHTASEQSRALVLWWTLWPLPRFPFRTDDSSRPVPSREQPCLKGAAWSQGGPFLGSGPSPSQLCVGRGQGVGNEEQNSSPLFQFSTPGKGHLASEPPREGGPGFGCKHQGFSPPPFAQPPLTAAAAKTPALRTLLQGCLPSPSPRTQDK